MTIENNYLLRELNTFGIASIADRFVALHHEGDFAELIATSLLRQGSFFILGGGSNVVLPDRYEGLVIHPANKGVRMIGSEGDYCFVEAAAGEVWADFVDHCIDHGWHGLENLSAIPGTVGAAPVQNVGAYGTEAKDVVERVHYYDIETGDEHWIESSDCQFAYRSSIFKDSLKGRCLIDRVVFRLTATYTPRLDYKALASAVEQHGLIHPSARQVADIVKEVRDSKLPDPKKIGSAGSFFKNPVVSGEKYEELHHDYPDLVAFPVNGGDYKLAAGWMIERCGWKGRTLGRVGVYDKQALVLVNRGGCSGSDVRYLADTIIADIRSRFGVTLECEAIFVTN